MSKLDYPKRSAALFRKAEEPVNTKPAATEPGVNRKGDRHKPGYMAEYMRKRRAK